MVIDEVLHNIKRKGRETVKQLQSRDIIIHRMIHIPLGTALVSWAIVLSTEEIAPEWGFLNADSSLSLSESY